MRLALRPKPKTVSDQVLAVRDQAIELARGVPEFLDSSRKRALAVVGTATGAAAGFAFWRSHKEERPSVHSDPAQPASPVSATPPPPAPDAANRPPAASSAASGTDARTGARSK